MDSKIHHLIVYKSYTIYKLERLRENPKMRNTIKIKN